MAERLFTTYQVADLLGATPGAVVEWIQKGWLPIQRLPDGPVRISEKGLVQFLKARGVNIKEVMAKAMEKESQRRQGGEVQRAVVADAEAVNPGASVAADAPAGPGMTDVTEPATEDEAILDDEQQARQARRELLRSPQPETSQARLEIEEPVGQAAMEELEEVLAAGEENDEEGPVELLPEVKPVAKEMPEAEQVRPQQPSELEEDISQAEPAGAEAAPEEEPPAPGEVQTEEFSARALLQRALAAGASHIHIDPGPEHWSVRMRVDGVLHEMFDSGSGQLDEEALRLLAEIKALAEMREAAGRPQRARLAVEIAGRSVPLRIVTVPTVYGQKLVIQSLEVSGLIPDLSEIGLEDFDAARLGTCLAQPSGMILSCGWPRSGSSATLLAMASTLSRQGMSVATIERKAEIGIQGLAQSKTDAPGLGFTELLDCFLDQDVDAVMIESLRDPATAKKALAAAEDGVKMLAGVTAPGPAQAIALLLEMGLESWPLSCVLTAVIAQRKARVLCPDCKKPASPDAELLRRLSLRPSDVEFDAFEPVGCANCFGTGYKGRTGLFAAVFGEDKLGAIVRAMANAGPVSLPSSDWGGRTLLEAGLAKARAGAISLAELARVLSA